jgi:PTH2 family peptidyl-tRNA hydrolase
LSGKGRDGSSYKQAVVVRTDLGMSTGKLAAQACHASLGSSEEVRKRSRGIWNRWQAEGGRKIVLAVASREELMDVWERAGRAKIPRYLVADKGLTEIPPGSKTAIGLGPAVSSRLDKVTGNIPLLK